MKKYSMVLVAIAVVAVATYVLWPKAKVDQEFAQVVPEETLSATPSLEPSASPANIKSSPIPATTPVSTMKPVAKPSVIPSATPIPSSNSVVVGPRMFVDTALPVQTGKTINVPAGGNFQQALDQAKPGDTILLAAGVTYKGPFTLPNKPGSGWIIIRSNAPDSKLPAQGKRITPSFASYLPKLISSSGPVIGTAPGAHNYRFIGIEIAPSSNTFLYEVVSLGADGPASNMPSHIIFDRSYIHGDGQKGSRHGIVMNSSQTAVIDSYVSDFKEAGADAQAIVSWNGAGPFKISNDYLEASGENLLFGGADPSIPNLVPSDIEIRGNLFSKPLAWKSENW
ncbi:MAG TPA: hypothetical protein VFK07_02545, partial [Candidatus Paceibacterota bacterium]|nr:hypothetical protein [Candidatus Paceibacterota bacterium]